MAIKIPSKKIFSIDNEKIRDNIIERVEISQKIGVLSAIPRDIAYSSTRVPQNVKPKNGDIEYKNDEQANDATSDSYYLVSRTQVEQAHFYAVGTIYHDYQIATVYIRIPKTKENKLIQSIDYIKKENNEDNKYVANVNKSPIRWQVEGYRNTYNIKNGTCQFYTSRYTGAYGYKWDWENDDAPIEKNIYGNLPTTDFNIKEITDDDENYLNGATQEVAAASTLFLPESYVYKKEVQDGSTDDFPSILSPIYKENVGFFELKFFVPTSFSIAKLNSKKIDTIQAENQYAPTSVEIEGIDDVYTATKINITIYGETIALNFNEETKKIGDTNTTNVYSESSNELIQSDNYYVDKNNENSHKNLAEKNCENIIKEYKNGKETATIKCTISDYYDEFGEKEKDITNPEKMIFNIGDEVIPYYPVYGGGEKPISYYDDKKTPKVFKVVNRKLSYKGAPFQTITIQEILKN